MSEQEQDFEFNVFMRARAGQIHVWEQMDNCVKGCAADHIFDEAKEAAEWLVENEIGNAMHSSSMDFSSEYGFPEDDLTSLIWEEAARLVADKSAPRH